MCKRLRNNESTNRTPHNPFSVCGNLELLGGFMNKKLIPLCACALFIGAAVLTSCGSKATEKDIFAISYNLSDPNMSGLWKPGLETASEKYGYNKIELFDAKNDDAEALKMVETAGTQAYGGYLINVVDQTNGLSYINKVKDTGKPVIFWNRELSTSTGAVDVDTMNSYKNAYYVGIESAEGGRYQGAMAAEYINSVGFENLDRNGDGKLGVIVVRGEKGHADAEARTQWSPAYLERNLEGGNPNAELKATASGGSYEVNTEKGAWNKVEVTDIVDGTDTAGTTWDPVTAANEVARVLNSKGDQIDLVLSNNDGMALGIITNQTFISAGIPIWGVDALDDALTEIKKEGQFKGTVKNDGAAQADVCVKALDNLIQDKSLTDGMTVVSTKEEWEANDKAVWYDSANKALRVHHAKITAETLK